MNNSITCSYICNKSQIFIFIFIDFVSASMTLIDNCLYVINYLHKNINPLYELISEKIFTPDAWQVDD